MEVESGTRLGTGIEGLDSILRGGLPANRLYLIQGDPGVGKTTLALQFLLEGRRLGEPTLYVTLSETREELDSVAASHGWSLDGIEVHEMAGGESAAVADENTLYLPSEIELGERMAELLAEVDRVSPRRIVLDSCTELRLLAQTPLRFRRQVLALKERLVQRQCTILLLETPGTRAGDAVLQSLVHGVVEMDQHAPMYGSERRRLRVVKMRAVKFRGGWHDITIAETGVRVFPRLVAAEHAPGFEKGVISSGIDGLDKLVGGGFDRGTSVLLLGPAGAGKSSLAACYAVSVANRGERAAFFAFDEGVDTLFTRSEALGMPLQKHVESGRITVQQVDPADLSPGEFACRLQHAVEVGGARLIVIDSLNGYLTAMPDQHYVLIQLHEVLSYLRQQGVVTLIALAQHGLVDPTMTTSVDVSYLADTVLVLRYFEASGRIRKAVSVLKKRSGQHEDTIREFSLGASGILVGPPLADFRGVLTGVPEFEGNPGAEGPLMGRRSD